MEQIYVRCMLAIMYVQQKTSILTVYHFKTVSASGYMKCEQKPSIERFTSHFLNQARAGRRPARAWFLEIAFVREVSMRVCVDVCVCVCVCVCVRPRGHK